MKSNTSRLSRRTFLQAMGLGAAAMETGSKGLYHSFDFIHETEFSEMPTNQIGAYGSWASTLVEDPPALSFRSESWTDIEAWRTTARERLIACLAQPDIGTQPPVTVHGQYTYDGLHIEELSWQLPYGPPTEAVLLKPAGATGPLPGVLALHDHGGNKVFGWQKIAQTGAERHPKMVQNHDALYGGTAWANELAKRGYAVLVPDVFPFASRKVQLADVPEKQRKGLSTGPPESLEEIDAYNRWAGAHEHIMAKSLFCAGTTWPGVFLGEDQRALDVLCARPDVDENRVGCGGLSGGGLRTVFLGGVDPRIKCAICVGMMTTWQDYLLYKSHTHTWMVYVPLLARELDYPEILGLRVPLPTLVQNNRQDPLFTLPEMERADQILQSVYTKANAGERYRCSFYDGPHKFDQEMQSEAFKWFDTWL
ncbi:MAG: dienelactone hydrolase family protein [Rhodothermales bacterium]